MVEKEGQIAMGNYLETEKPKQVQFKVNSDTISVPAKADGLFKGLARPFCLPPEYAEENLYHPSGKRLWHSS